MPVDEKVTLYYMPQTRAAGTRVILEELGVPYDVHVMNFKAGENRQAEYLAVNPMGKVPAIRHGDVFVTEQIACALYLGDAFPEAKLAPVIGDPRRGAYLRWMIFYASCLEPAVTDKSMGREPPPLSRSFYGDYDEVIDAVEAALQPGPFFFGDELSVADIQWGMAFRWLTMFELIPKRPAFMQLVDLITSRPSFKKVDEEDKRLAAEHEAAMNSAG